MARTKLTNTYFCRWQMPNELRIWNFMGKHILGIDTWQTD